MILGSILKEIIIICIVFVLVVYMVHMWMSKVFQKMHIFRE